MGKVVLVHYGSGVQIRGDVKVVENCTRSPMFLSLARSIALKECFLMMNFEKKIILPFLTLFSMGYFKNTTVWGGAIMAPLVTSLFLEVQGQNLVAWGILMCLLQKWH